MQTGAGTGFPPPAPVGSGMLLSYCPALAGMEGKKVIAQNKKAQPAIAVGLLLGKKMYAVRR